MKLEDNLIKYKNITLSIIEMIRAEEYEKLDGVFQERQLILDNINEINYSQDELKKFYFGHNIDKLDEMLDLEMKLKKEDLLEKIKENKKRQTAINGYNNLSTKAVFLSKEL